MNKTQRSEIAILLFALFLCPTLSLGEEVAADFIEGVVRNQSGTLEAGVWVIAETTDLATPYRKIVVTDDDGNFVIPELPAADYQLWVRGYGLRDSARTGALPGNTLELIVADAANEIEAASIYPASYWLSLLSPPDHDPDWVNSFKLNCQLCHQIGSLATRIQNRELFDTGLRKSTNMNAVANRFGRDQLLETLSDWTARIRAGETPAAPPRPRGAERNLVITQWEWGDGFTYAHDEIATDKRNPTLFPNGPIYGVDLGNDRILALNPVTHTASEYAVPTLNGFDTPWCEQVWKRDNDGITQNVPMGFGSLGCPVEPGITGFEGQYPNPANPHNPMFDADGKVWITTQVRREWDEDLLTSAGTNLALPAITITGSWVGSILQPKNLNYSTLVSVRIIFNLTRMACYGPAAIPMELAGSTRLNTM